MNKINIGKIISSAASGLLIGTIAGYIIGQEMNKPIWAATPLYFNQDEISDLVVGTRNGNRALLGIKGTLYYLNSDEYLRIANEEVSEAGRDSLTTVINPGQGNRGQRYHHLGIMPLRIETIKRKIRNED